MTNRWWIYQKERFPIFAHGPMVIVFCLSIMLFSSLQADDLPSLGRISGAVVSTLILFFQLRVADEFKDFADDSKYRPHRPVPRGLISLRDLARVAWAGALVQFVIALQTDFGLIPILAFVWLYMGLMTKEFFVPAWLKKTPSVYLLSHMLVMPLIAFYVSAFDWLCTCRVMPSGLTWLLLFSFACGLVLELGRKIKSPDDERPGVETYSSLWGSGAAVLVWVAAGALTVGTFLRASTFFSGVTSPFSLAIGLAAFALLAFIFFHTKSSIRPARFIESGSGVFAMLLYLGLGPLQAVVS